MDMVSRDNLLDHFKYHLKTRMASKIEKVKKPEEKGPKASNKEDETEVEGR